MRPFNILVTAGSRRVPLVQGFRTALRSLGLPGVVIVTDVNPLSPAVHVADRAYRVPMSSDPAYLDEIQEICESEQVRLVVPTIDDELPIFAVARESFRMRGIHRGLFAGAGQYAVQRQARHLPASARRRSVRRRLIRPCTDLPGDAALPLFIKPRTGRGAVGAFPVRFAA